MGKKYKVHYSGFAYVDADNVKEAEENFFDELIVYAEHGVDSVEEVDESEVDV